MVFFVGLDVSVKRRPSTWSRGHDPAPGGFVQLSEDRVSGYSTAAACANGLSKSALVANAETLQALHASARLNLALCCALLLLM